MEDDDNKAQSDRWEPQELISWDVDEFIQYDRGTTWYVLMIGGGTALLIYAVASANFLFALIILMFALIMYLSSVTPPRRVRFSITDMGIELGDNFFPYADISSFWFTYEPPAVKDLHVEFRNILAPRRTVDLEEQNPNVVRELLSQYVLEDLTKDEEPLSDTLGRLFKL